MIYSCKQDGCGYETKEEIQYCPKCGHNIIAIDDQKIKEEEANKIREGIENDVINEFNNLVCDKKTATLLASGWEMKNTKIPVLKGIKNAKGKYIFSDKSFISCIIDGEIGTEKKIAEYPLKYLDIAKKLGAESIIIMEKDFPCFGKLPNGRFIVIAPRVE